MQRLRRDLLKLAMASLLLPSAARTAAATDALTLGFQTTTWGAVGMVAEALHTFQKFNVPVKVQTFDSGVSVRDAMIGGRVDIGVSSVSSFIVGVDKGTLTAIAAVAYSGASNSIMVAKDSPIKSPAELRGKKIASQFGAGSDYTFRTKVLPKFGLKPEDLALVNAKYADHVAALASGSVDGFVGTEPYPAISEAQGIARQLLSFEEYDLVPVVLAINRPVLKQRRTEVVAFMKGWLAAVHLFSTDPALAVKTVAQVFAKQGHNLPDQVVKVALDRLGVDPDFRPQLVPYLQAQAEELVKEHKIAKIPDWNQALDRTILKDARNA